MFVKQASEFVRLVLLHEMPGCGQQLEPGALDPAGELDARVGRLGDCDHASVSLVKRVVTIGVYEWDLDTFLEALRAGDVRLLLDVRQRRGVRGRQYAWANAVRLQDALGAAGVAYRHHPE